MNARGKLNFAFVNGSLVAGALAGIVFNSFIVFAVVALVGIVLGLYVGDIRPTPRQRPHHRADR
jgi:hypothetical protein